MTQPSRRRGTQPSSFGSAPNPYAAPVPIAGTTESMPLAEGERILFRGGISRDTILTALVKQPIFHASVEEAEQRLLEKHPELYREDRTGWFDAEGLQLHGEDYDLWVRWPAIYSVSTGEYLMEVTFAGGLSGSAMFEVDQFVPALAYTPHQQFTRAIELTSDRLLQVSREWPEFVDSLCLPPSAQEQWPTAEQALAIGKMQLTSRANYWLAIKSTLQNHLKNLFFFNFGIAAFHVSLFSQLVDHPGIWLAIALVLFNALYGVAVLRPLWPLFRGGDRFVLLYEMRLTEHDIWMALSSALVRRRIDSYRVFQIDAEKITLQRCENGIETTFERTMFATEADWQRTVERLQRAAQQQASA